MKKLAIAGASVALAAMPVVGVFAANVDVTDTLTTVIGNGCNVTIPDGRDAQANFGTVGTPLVPGAATDATDTTGAFTFTCNAGWTMTVTGNDLTAASGTGTAIKGTAENSKGSWYKLQLGLTKSAGDTSVSITNPYADPAAFISSSVTSASAVTNLSVVPTYTVHVGEAQEPNTYSGTVVYSVGITGA